MVTLRRVSQSRQVFMLAVKKEVMGGALRFKRYATLTLIFFDLCQKSVLEKLTSLAADL